jgi:hypothetical protein
MRFEKVWTGQCRATKGIKRRFGAKSALDYLIGEKLTTFADAAEEHPEFRAGAPEIPGSDLAALQRVRDRRVCRQSKAPQAGEAPTTPYPAVTWLAELWLGCR